MINLQAAAPLLLTLVSAIVYLLSRRPDVKALALALFTVAAFWTVALVAGHTRTLR